jgi:hypothetical protein
MKEDRAKRDDTFFDRCQCFASVTSFCGLSFVFCGIIINQLLLQVNNIRFFYLTMIFMNFLMTFSYDVI